MFLYILFLVACCCISLDLHKTIGNTAVVKYEQLKTLATIVGKNQKSIIQVIWLCFYIIGKTLYHRVWQFLNRSVKNIGKNKYEVSYVINGILYKFIVTCKRGPKTILQVVNDKDEDITDIFQQYAGPNEDFYGQKFTSLFFNSENVHILKSTGEELDFTNNAVINLV